VEEEEGEDYSLKKPLIKADRTLSKHNISADDDE